MSLGLHLGPERKDSICRVAAILLQAAIFPTVSAISVEPGSIRFSLNWFQQGCDYAVKRRRKVGPWAREQSEHQPLRSPNGVRPDLFFFCPFAACVARGGRTRAAAGPQRPRDSRRQAYEATVLGLSSSPADAAGADSSSSAVQCVPQWQAESRPLCRRRLVPLSDQGLACATFFFR
jgi:hypothetical protein